MMNEDEHTKEVYARFGLAVYCAQVLECDLVNAIVIMGLIPSRRHLASSREEWTTVVDAFTDGHFQTTMGRLIRALREETTVPSDLESLFLHALKRRNWLVHRFFRERAVEFMSASGREQMLTEVDECRACFEAAGRRLDEIVRPLRVRAGITDEWLEREYARVMSGLRHEC